MGAKRRFPNRVDEAYTAWLHDRPCVLWDNPHHVCWGTTETHHVISRGAGGSDHQQVPLCKSAHAEGHNKGWKTFEAKYNVRLLDCSAKLYAWYREENP